MKKTVGIIGGMGPQSTIELMNRIVELTPVEREQEHIRMLVDSRPQIPDRTAFILDSGPSPLPMMVESARLLEEWGADFLAIACNTAHLFIREIQQTVTIPVLNMLDLLSRDLQEKIPPGTSVILLTTSGALKAGLFRPYLDSFNIVLPSPAVQEEVIMNAIYGRKGVKCGKNFESHREKIRKVIRDLLPQTPRAVIAGCTEIGLLLRDEKLDIDLVNPLDILAARIVELAVSGK